MQAYIYILMCGTISRGSASSRSKLSRGRRASVGLDLSGSRWPPRRGAKRPAFSRRPALGPGSVGQGLSEASGQRLCAGPWPRFWQRVPGRSARHQGIHARTECCSWRTGSKYCWHQTQRKHIGSCVDSAVRDVPGSQGPTWIGPLPRAYAVPGHRKIPQGKTSTASILASMAVTAMPSPCPSTPRTTSRCRESEQCGI